MQPQVEVASHTEPAFSPLPHQPHFKVGHGRISVDYELRSSYYAARARHRRYGLAVLGIAMVHVAQFLTSLTLNPRFVGSDATHLCSDGDDFCKGVSSEVSLHLLARSDLIMVSELGAREHGAMQASKLHLIGPSTVDAGSCSGLIVNCKIDRMTRVAARSICGQDDKTGWLIVRRPHVIPDGNPLAGSGRAEFLSFAGGESRLHWATGGHSTPCLSRYLLHLGIH